jgi:hypothetical protein
VVVGVLVGVGVVVVAVDALVGESSLVQAASGVTVRATSAARTVRVCCLMFHLRGSSAGFYFTGSNPCGSNAETLGLMLFAHSMRQVDLVGACRAFVSVSERGSFTVGAAALRMSQSVASRRVAALEERYGERLFERTGRRAVLTPFGRDLLPAARQVVRAAGVLDHEAEVAKRRPWRLAVPTTCGTARLAQLIAEARAHGVVLEVQVAAAGERAELVHSQQVRAALLAVPADEARWSVPLGLAGELKVSRVYVATLRPSRTRAGSARRIWIQPEDDVPHIRDPLTRLRDAVARCLGVPR